MSTAVHLSSVTPAAAAPGAHRTRSGAAGPGPSIRFEAALDAALGSDRPGRSGPSTPRRETVADRQGERAGDRSREEAAAGAAPPLVPLPVRATSHAGVAGPTAGSGGEEQPDGARLENLAPADHSGPAGLPSAMTTGSSQATAAHTMPMTAPATPTVALGIAPGGDQSLVIATSAVVNLGAVVATDVPGVLTAPVIGPVTGPGGAYATSDAGHPPVPAPGSIDSTVHSAGRATSSDATTASGPAMITTTGVAVDTITSAAHDMTGTGAPGGTVASSATRILSADAPTGPTASFGDDVSGHTTGEPTGPGSGYPAAAGEATALATLAPPLSTAPGQATHPAAGLVASGPATGVLPASAAAAGAGPATGLTGTGSADQWPVDTAAGAATGSSQLASALGSAAASTAAAGAGPAATQTSTGPFTLPQLTAVPGILAAALSTRGTQQLLVELSPAALGPVRVRATLRQGSLTVELAGGADVAREAMRGVLADLTASLAKAGIDAAVTVRDTTFGDSGSPLGRDPGSDAGASGGSLAHDQPHRPGPPGGSGDQLPGAVTSTPVGVPTTHARLDVRV